MLRRVWPSQKERHKDVEICQQSMVIDLTGNDEPDGDEHDGDRGDGR